MTIDGEKIIEFSIVGEEGGIFEFSKPLTTLQEVYEKLKIIKETDRKEGYKDNYTITVYTEKNHFYTDFVLRKYKNKLSLKYIGV